MNLMKILVIIVIVFLPLQVCAQPSDITLEKETKESVSFKGRVDLDDDGHLDNIQVWFLNIGEEFGNERFVVEVNRASMVCWGTSLNIDVKIVDIDSKDQYREIAISERGPSDDHATYYFRFIAGDLKMIGKVPTSPWFEQDVDGSGEIKTKNRGKILHTWFYPCTFRYDYISNELREVRNGPIIMNTPVTLKVDLEVRQSPVRDGIAGVIKKGEKATILDTNDIVWCKIRSESGVEGYFSVGGGKIIEKGMWGGDVFDGLSFAD
ncbi:MAG: SH3 domain-containing protein [Candidatus Latescibacteria bacterium]|nr:SH3 domain-containing protein [Candidatus Latescibacterota bacterium]